MNQGAAGTSPAYKHKSCILIEQIKLRRVTYTGVSKKVALENLNARIKEDMLRAGLKDFHIRVEDVDGEAGIPDYASTRSSPKDATPDQCARAEEIANRHVRDFRKQRY